jgi:hypothetical protein
MGSGQLMKRSEPTMNWHLPASSSFSSSSSMSRRFFSRTKDDDENDDPILALGSKTWFVVCNKESHGLFRVVRLLHSEHPTASTRSAVLKPHLLSSLHCFSAVARSLISRRTNEAHILSRRLCGEVYLVTRCFADLTELSGPSQDESPMRRSLEDRPTV